MVAWSPQNTTLNLSKPWLCHDNLHPHPRPQMRVTLPIVTTLLCPLVFPGHRPGHGDVMVTNWEQGVAIRAMTLGRRVLSPLNGTKYWLTHDQRQARCFLRLSLCPREFLLCYFVDMPCIVIWSTQTHASPRPSWRCHKYSHNQSLFLWRLLSCQNSLMSKLFFQQRFIAGHVCIACYLYISALWSKL